MKVSARAEADKLVDPQSPVWESAESVTVPLAKVPVQSQPNEYIRVAWADRDYGQTGEAQLQALTSDGRLYVRVSWEDDSRPNGEFPDAVAVIFGEGDSLATLGNRNAPVELWYWEDTRNEPLAITSSGPGVFKRHDANGLAAGSSLGERRWNVVLCGPQDAAANARVGVAVWNGSNDERAGLAAVSREWESLETERGS
jgi:DMSO reductase family type II enzyme heme b subunit